MHSLSLSSARLPLPAVFSRLPHRQHQRRPRRPRRSRASRADLSAAQRREQSLREAPPLRQRAQQGSQLTPSTHRGTPRHAPGSAPLLKDPHLGWVLVGGGGQQALFPPPHHRTRARSSADARCLTSSQSTDFSHSVQRIANQGVVTKQN